MWEEVSDPAKLHISREVLEELFAQKAPQTQDNSMHQNTTQSTQQLLDPKRQQNLGIAFARYESVAQQYILYSSISSFVQV